MNKILAFDVSNNICTVALSVGNEILSYQEDLRPSRQAEMLIPLIENALNLANLNYQDLDYIASTVGPGSFTGIKIGLSTAKAIARATKAKLIGISNFESSFYRLKQQISYYENAAIILNAYRDQFYLQIFKNNQEVLPAKLIDQDMLREELIDYSHKLVITGNGISLVYNELLELTDTIILPRFPSVKATHIARCANEKIHKGDYSVLKPLYVRSPDAKIPGKLL